MMTTHFLSTSFFQHPRPVFTAIGVGVVGLFVAKNVFRFAKFVWNHLLSPTINFTQLGEYAVITGSTDGIGKAYAFELAKRGMNLVLISRSQSRLEATSKEIGNSYPNTKIKLIAVDFETTHDIYERIKTELSSIDVGILVNNVGTLIGRATTPLVDRTEAEVVAIINVNVMAAVQMSRLVLPQMIAKRRGVIVNMSSGVVLFRPVCSLYAITKKFLQSFSYMLRLQCEKYGIIIQEVEPLLVDTKMAAEVAKRAPLIFGLTMVTPETVARQALQTVGRYTVTHGAIYHEIQAAIIQSLQQISSLTGIK